MASAQSFTSCVADGPKHRDVISRPSRGQSAEGSLQPVVVYLDPAALQERETLGALQEFLNLLPGKRHTVHGERGLLTAKLDGEGDGRGAPFPPVRHAADDAALFDVLHAL